MWQNKCVSGMVSIKFPKKISFITIPTMKSPLLEYNWGFHSEHALNYSKEFIWLHELQRCLVYLPFIEESDSISSWKHSLIHCGSSLSLYFVLLAIQLYWYSCWQFISVKKVKKKQQTKTLLSLLFHAPPPSDRRIWKIATQNSQLDEEQQPNGKSWKILANRNRPTPRRTMPMRTAGMMVS